MKILKRYIFISTMQPILLVLTFILANWDKGWRFVIEDVILGSIMIWFLFLILNLPLLLLYFYPRKKSLKQVLGLLACLLPGSFIVLYLIIEFNGILFREEFLCLLPTIIASIGLCTYTFWQYTKGRFIITKTN